MEFRRQTKLLVLLGNGRTTECLAVVILITVLIQRAYKGKGKVHSSTGQE